MPNSHVFTGLDGAISLAVESGVEGNAASGVNDTYGLTPIGRATGVSIEVTSDIRPFHEMGQRYATELRSGNVFVKGTIGRAHVNGALLKLMLGDGGGGSRPAGSFVSPTFNLSLRMENSAFPGNASTVTVHGVKLDRWAFTMPEDDFVMEEVGFQALWIGVEDAARVTTFTPGEVEAATPLLTADDLLLGGRVTHAVAVPAEVMAPADSGGAPGHVVLRPLVLADVHRVQRAARDDQALTSVLMVQQSLVEPAVTVDQVNRMHCGLVEFLLGEVNRISGLTMGRDELEEVVRAPMARACFELARTFGWTADECAALTVGQVLMYLELAGRGRPADGESA